MLRQDTRWSSTFSMVKRYFDLLPFLDRDDEDIAELLPSPSTNKKLEMLLEMVESVSKRLQSYSVTMRDLRILFDGLIKEKPLLRGYLGKNASLHISFYII